MRPAVLSKVRGGQELWTVACANCSFRWRSMVRGCWMRRLSKQKLCHPFDRQSVHRPELSYLIFATTYGRHPEHENFDTCRRIQLGLSVGGEGDWVLAGRRDVRCWDIANRPASTCARKVQKGA